MTEAIPQAIKTARVTFQVRTMMGDQPPLHLVGSTEQLAAWNPDRALELQRVGGANSQQLWEIKQELPIGQRMEFKFLFKTSQGVIWEQGENRLFKVPNAATAVYDGYFFRGFT